MVRADGGTGERERGAGEGQRDNGDGEDSSDAGDDEQRPRGVAAVDVERVQEPREIQLSEGNRDCAGGAERCQRGGCDPIRGQQFSVVIDRHAASLARRSRQQQTADGTPATG
jgi:hypothetical protein